MTISKLSRVAVAAFNAEAGAYFTHLIAAHQSGEVAGASEAAIDAFVKAAREATEAEAHDWGKNDNKKWSTIFGAARLLSLPTGGLNDKPAFDKPNATGAKAWNDALNLAKREVLDMNPDTYAAGDLQSAQLRDGYLSAVSAASWVAIKAANGDPDAYAEACRKAWVLATPQGMREHIRDRFDASPKVKARIKAAEDAKTKAEAEAAAEDARKAEAKAAATAKAAPSEEKAEAAPAPSEEKAEAAPAPSEEKAEAAPAPSEEKAEAAPAPKAEGDVNVAAALGGDVAPKAEAAPRPRGVSLAGQERDRGEDLPPLPKAPAAALREMSRMVRHLKALGVSKQDVLATVGTAWK